MNKKLTQIAAEAKNHAVEVTDLGDMLEVAGYDYPTDYWHMTWYRIVRGKVASAHIPRVDLEYSKCPPLLLDRVRDIVRAEFAKLSKPSTR